MTWLKSVLATLANMDTKKMPLELATAEVIVSNIESDLQLDLHKKKTKNSTNEHQKG